MGNMKHTLTAWPMALMLFVPSIIGTLPATAATLSAPTITAAPVRPAATATTLYLYDLPDGVARVFGYLRYDTRYRTYGMAGMRTDQPQVYNLLHDFGNKVGETPVLTAGTFVGDRLYAYETTLYANVLMPAAISVVNPETGEIERQVTIPESAPYLILDEMTYEPASGTLYGMHYDTDASQTELYTIDLATLALTKVATLPQALFTLTADGGWLYGIAAARGTQGDCRLVRIDQRTIDPAKQTCEIQYVGDATGTGINLGNFSQSMEFDKTTHRLWWAAQTADDRALLVELDPITGKALSQTEIPGSPQLLTLSIPYQYVSDRAPSYVRSLEAQAGAQGQPTASLTWTNPATDYRNHQLAELSGLRIERNGQTVASLTEGLTPGQAMQWTDNNLSDGLYTYSLVPLNSEGNGVRKDVQVYVGQDVPGAPRNVTLQANGTRATLRWQAPETGAHGGYFESEGLRYNVRRLPDGKEVASGITATTLTDEATTYAGYSYEVTAVNSKGSGTPATSNVVAFGEGYGVPFTSTMQTADDFNAWTVINANADDQTWVYSAADACALYSFGEKAANDWLVSPPLMLDASKVYQLRYTYYSSNYVDGSSHEPVRERMKVYYGQQPTVEGLNVLVKDLGQFHTGSGEYLYGKDLFGTDATGAAYLAFQACSDADRGLIYLKDISVREYSTTDLSVRKLTGSETANRNVTQKFTVTVGNEGSADVNDYRVQLINAETGEVLAETAGTPVKKDGTTEVIISWTPATEGTVQVQARVVLDGDTYPADNVTASPLAVRVYAEQADNWLTLGTDESEGWAIPFYLTFRYGQVQSLFLENELQHPGVDFTGLQLVYNGRGVEAYSFPARISFKTTERSTVSSAADPYTGEFENDGWTEVYDGTLTVDGSEADTELTVPFDAPFHYNGGNLLVKFELPVHSNVLDSSVHPEWHFANGGDSYRTAFYRGSSSAFSPSDVFVYEYVPFLRLLYKGGSGTGILTPVDEGSLQVSQSGDLLRLSQTCDEVALYTPAGVCVARASRATELSVRSLPAGVYVLQARTDNGRQSIKIALRH